MIFVSSLGGHSDVVENSSKKRVSQRFVTIFFVQGQDICEDDVGLFVETTSSIVRGNGDLLGNLCSCCHDNLVDAATLDEDVVGVLGFIADCGFT